MLYVAVTIVAVCSYQGLTLKISRGILMTIIRGWFSVSHFGEFCFFPITATTITTVIFWSAMLSEWVIMEFNVAAGIFHPFATMPCLEAQSETWLKCISSTLVVNVSVQIHPMFHEIASFTKSITSTCRYIECYVTLTYKNNMSILLIVYFRATISIAHHYFYH